MRRDTKFEPRDDEVFFSWEDSKGVKHSDIMEEIILAKLLLDGILFVGDFNTGPFFENDKPESTTCVWVNCNDVFAWACADCEPITTAELPELYKMHKSDTSWGSIKWCCKKRNLQPQDPMIDMMKEQGAWDEMMKSLPKNTIRLWGEKE